LKNCIIIGSEFKEPENLHEETIVFGIKGKEYLRIEKNGDVYVYQILIGKDVLILRGLRDFINNNGINTQPICAFIDCDKKSVSLACGREHDEPMWYCEEHTKEIVDEGRPEYIKDCPNCGCQFGVN